MPFTFYVWHLSRCVDTDCTIFFLLHPMTATPGLSHKQILDRQLSTVLCLSCLLLSVTLVSKTGILWGSLNLTLLERQDDNFLLSTWGPTEQIYLNSVILPQTYPPVCWSSLSWCDLQAMSWRTHGQIRETRIVPIGEHFPCCGRKHCEVIFWWKKEDFLEKVQDLRRDLGY